MVSLWVFLVEQGVEATNKRAEGVLRFGVFWRKPSFAVLVDRSVVHSVAVNVISPGFIRPSPFIPCERVPPTSRFLATGSRDNTVKIWDIEKQEVVAKKELSDDILFVEFSPQGR